jgi:hypothetical protein
LKELNMANSKKTLILRSLPPPGRVDEPARKNIEADGDQRVGELLAAGTEPLPHGTFNGALSNGDESDARMAEIEVILDHAAMPHLGKCELVAEWVQHAEVKVGVFGQVDHKPGGGRPEGGIARAARALTLPGKTTEARRKFVERAVKINTIWPEVKVAARGARLDNIQSSLLAIADENSPDKQLAKVKELAERKALPRRKGKAAASEPAATAETNARTTGVSELGSSIKSEIDESKPASIAALVEFAKFMLARTTQGEKIVLTLTAVKDVMEFNRLANRVRLVLGRGSEHSSSESESNRGSSSASSQLFKPVDEGPAPL